MKQRWTRRLLYGLCAIHFSIVIDTNFGHLYKHLPKSERFAHLHPLFGKLINTDFLGLYASYTGIHGGYTFYSPSVGNSYQIHFHCQSNKVNSYYNSPGIRTEAGRIRYQSFLDMSTIFLEKDQEEAKESVRLAVKLATEEFVRQYPSDSIVSTLITKLTPTLEALRSDHHQKTVYVSLYQYASTSSTTHL